MKENKSQFVDATKHLNEVANEICATAMAADVSFEADAVQMVETVIETLRSSHDTISPTSDVSFDLICPSAGRAI